MILFLFSSRSWQGWDLGRAPLIPERMPVLLDEDLRLEDGPGAARSATVVNRWLRELPLSGVPAARSWVSYARAVKEWMEFLTLREVGLFDSRVRLRQALGAYAEYRATGPLPRRFAASTWNQHVSILSLFYRWAIAEGHAPAEPFTYRSARALFDGTGREVRVNLARRRRPKPHVTIKYLEPDFIELFLRGLRGLTPAGEPDAGFRGRELARNAAVAQLALATGLRLQEFSYLLTYEIPPAPGGHTLVPLPFAVPSGVAKGGKFRTTWISYEALAAAHEYMELERAATTHGSAWLPPPGWGEPLLVSQPDARGGRVNGVRRRWDTLTPGERRRLVAPGGGSCVLAVKAGGGPFSAWASVFERTSDRIRADFEPRFPHVHPHRLRHSFSMRTLEYLVSGHYRQAAALVANTGPDAALALYLSKADPLLVLRDLLGHASAMTTEKYLRRLDTTRIYPEVYQQGRIGEGVVGHAAAQREADAEFADEPDGETC